MLERTQHTGFGLDPACPVEWFHPLSKGLLAKWMVAPNSGWRGGSTVRDLVRGAHTPNDGTFANVTPAAAWKGARGRTGGYGSILLDGSNQQVNCGTSNALCLTGDTTVACWMKGDGGGRGGEILVGNANASANANWCLGYDNAGTKKIDWWHGGSLALSSTGAVDTNWHHIVVVRVGAATPWTINFYIDGLLDRSTTTTTALANLTGITTAIGTFGAYNAYYQYGGFIDDVCVYGRALSGTQVAALYAESRRGYPDALRWCSTTVWSLPGTDTSVPTGAATVAGINPRLDVTCPIEWAHPINLGLIGKWMVTPNTGWRGGSTLRDLVRGGHAPNDGALTNGPTWVGSRDRPGGCGAIHVDKVAASYVDCGNYTLFNSFRTSGAVFCWMRATADPQGSHAGIVSCYDDVVTGSGWEIEWNLDSDTVRVAILNGGGLGFGNGVNITFSANDFTWHHIGLVWDGATVYGYKDGVVAANTAQTVNVGSQTRRGLWIGRVDNGNSFTGDIDDVTVYNRALPAAQVRALYNQSRCGYPDALRWLPTRTWFVPPVAVAGIQFDAASNSGYQAAQSTYSWSHTCTGTNRYLAVDISLLSVPGTVVLALTYAGIEMDPLGARSTVSGAGRVECWGLTNPATGTNTVSVTLSASVASSGTAVSYTGVNQQEPTEGFASAQATNVGAADATVNVVTVADNDWVHGAIATDDTAVTANQTSRNNVSGALGSGADEDTGPKTPAGSVTMSYTGVGALATWVIAAYAIRPTTAPVEDVVASWYTLRTVIEEEIEVLTN